MQAVVDSGQVIVSLAGARARPHGGRGHRRSRPTARSVLVKTGELIEERHAEAIEKAQVQEVRIRSVLTCDTVTGVCAKCYGRDLARGTPVNIGEAVGVIAAQSIGEPGTQLTMRTFHIGGTANVVDQSFIESNFNGKVKIKNRAVVKDSQGRDHRHDPHHVDRHRRPERQGAGERTRCPTAPASTSTRATRSSAAPSSPSGIPTPGRSSPRSRQGGLRGSHRRRLGARADGRDEGHDQPRHRRLARYPALSRPEACDRHQGRQGQADQGRSAAATLAICFPSTTILSVEPGADVKAGDVLARIPMSSARSGDITGGLPRVAELFEARRPKDHAIIAEISGTVEFGKDYKNKQRIAIKPDDANAEVRRVPDPARQELGGATRRPRRAWRLRLRRPSRAARHPRHQGRRGARQLSRSTRSRTSTGCRA